MSPEEKEQTLERLEEENKALRSRIAELERRLGLDSQTSSKPPACDGLKKANKIRTSSLREKGKRRSGGQIGHTGQTLKKVLEPDNIVEHLTPCSCLSCGCDISQIEAQKIIKRQVFDIPSPKMSVTEHQVLVKECPECKAHIQGSFPELVKSPVQYGARIKAVAAYLNHQHFIPEDRLSKALMYLLSCQMTPGTIAKTTKTLADIIEPVVIEIASLVKAAPVKHLDETILESRWKN